MALQYVASDMLVASRKCIAASSGSGWVLCGVVVLGRCTLACPVFSVVLILSVFLLMGGIAKLRLTLPIRKPCTATKQSFFVASLMFMYDR